MGLGKTIQVLALLLVQRAEAAEAAHKPCLLVAPASLLANWAAEIDRFAPDLTAGIVHPSAMPADALKRLEPGDLQTYDLVITSYGTIAPGYPTGTLELNNASVTMSGSTLAIKLLDLNNFSKLKVSGTGAKLNLQGAGNVLNVSLVGKYNWQGQFTVRIFEGGPLTGTFGTVLWNGTPVTDQFTVKYGANYIDLVVEGAPGTVVIVR